MRSTLRDLGRARGRTIVCVIALALAIGTIGIFAVPNVATSSLRRIAANDRLAHLTVDTTPIRDAGALAAIPGVDAMTTRVSFTTHLADGTEATVLGTEFASGVDNVRRETGRVPTVDGEVLISPQVDTAGATSLAIGSGDGASTLTVVGTGETAAFAGTKTLYTTPATALRLAALGGPNQVALRMTDPTDAHLDAATRRLRRTLAFQGVAITSLPVVLPGGAHPVEDSITEISTMIGMLGIVAGIVALVLLASTTNAIVTERSRDAAILRALGAPRRTVRRRLRRLALAIAVMGVIVGIPLGILVSNVVARMVLTRFAGITPSIGVSIPVMIGSILFAVVGARLISGRAARRLTRVHLAEALRDRDGAPFGNRWSDRLLSRLRAGSLFGRIAVRSAARRRARAFALVAQVACAVGAAVTVASLGTSVANFNEAEMASWNWKTVTTATDPGYPYAVTAADEPRVGTEPGLYADAQLDDWDLDVWGIDPATAMVDTEVDSGRWITSSDTSVDGVGSAVLASHFAHQVRVALGDTITVQLASGPARYNVVGLHPIKSVALFVPRSTLAADLGAGTNANVVWTSDAGAVPPSFAAASTTKARTDLYEEDKAARTAILGIFTAIGLIVVAVATLGVVSTVGMSLYERRHELAVLRALGGRTSQLFRVIGLELVPLAAIGWVIGVGAGWAAARGIMGFFETSSGIDLGYVFASASVVTAAVSVVVGTVAVALVLGPTAGEAVTRGGFASHSVSAPVCDTQPVEPAPVIEASAPKPSTVWPTIRQNAIRWFRPLSERPTWRSAGYLGIGVFSTLLWACVVGLLFSAGAIAVCTVVGIPLVIPIYGAIAAVSSAERTRARLIHVPIPPRPLADGPGLWSRSWARLRDGARWRQIAYHLTAWAVAFTVALVALIMWGAVLYLVSLPLWGWAVGLSFFAGLALGALGIALAGLSVRTMVWCARLGAEYAAWLLGPDRFELMRSQVDTLTADRRQILDAVAGERRRIERNLHDGVQARLVALGIDLGMAEAMLPGRPDEARALIASARDKTRDSIGELRVIGRGLHPSILEDRGLDAALSAVVAAAPIPIRLRCDLEEPIPPALEEAAYFIVSEAVSNLLKHARARTASVDVTSDHDRVRIVVHDDGVGGAEIGRGSGLEGIDARVRGVDGVLRIASPPGGPTVLAVDLPMPRGGWGAVR